MLQAPRVGRDDLALHHNHDPVDIALNGHHLKCELSRDAVPVAIEGHGLILVHRNCGADDAGIEPMCGERRGEGLFLGEPCADRKGAEERLDSSLPLGFAPLTKIPVQLIEVRHFGDRGGEAALHGLDGALGVGSLYALTSTPWRAPGGPQSSLYPGDRQAARGDNRDHPPGESPASSYRPKLPFIARFSNPPSSVSSGSLRCAVKLT